MLAISCGILIYWDQFQCIKYVCRGGAFIELLQEHRTQGVKDILTWGANLTHSAHE